MIWKDSLRRREFQPRRLIRRFRGQRAMLFDFGQHYFEQCWSRSVNLNARIAAVRAAMTDLNLENFKFSAEGNDEIEDLGKNQRVYNMTRNLNNTPRHSPTILSRSHSMRNAGF